MGHHPNAEATWEAPYGTLTGELWLWVSETSPPTPLGVYDRPDNTPGVQSIRLPDGQISGWLRDATRFLERLDDAMPGLADFFGVGG